MINFPGMVTHVTLILPTSLRILNRIENRRPAIIIFVMLDLKDTVVFMYKAAIQ